LAPLAFFAGCGCSTHDRVGDGAPRFRVDDLLTEHCRSGGELAELAVDVTVDLLGHRVWRGTARMR
jgi:hypothetical protein